MKKIKHRKQMRTTTILLIGKKKNGMVEKKNMNDWGLSRRKEWCEVLVKKYIPSAN